MIRAILDGRKTVTRRAVKPQPTLPTTQWWPSGGVGPMWMADGPSEATGGKRQTWGWKRCPYGEVGDRLWVRETYCGNHYLHPHEPEDERELHFRADGVEDFEGERIQWRPGIHMPRWASRITLEVAAVRVERLQDISYEQALAEGAMNAAATIDHFQPGGEETGDETARRLRWPQRDFELIWESINGAGSWAANPWVWVVEFKRVEVPHG